MKLAKFEEKLALAKLKMIGRYDEDGMVIFVADGYSNGAAEFIGPHYRTIYAIGRSPDSLVLAQSIYHEFGHDLGKKHLQEARVQDAFQMAIIVVARLKERNGIIKT